MLPLLSIIIANTNGQFVLTKCLSALEEQMTNRDVEVIVVELAEPEPTHATHRQFTWVKYVPVDRGSPIPQMLKSGLERSRGEIIAILEDHEVVNPDWCEAVLAAHRAYPEVAAIAGPIENGCISRIIDWAAFFCEYCRFMPPVPAATTEFIPGNNVAYKRWALEEIAPEDLAGGFWVNTLHPHLLKRGCQFRMEPGLTVSHQMQFGFFEFLVQRYHYSRYHAGSLMLDQRLFARMAYSAIRPVLPVILLKRILSCGFTKNRFRKELMYSTPLLMCFTAVWAFGEMIGALFGPGQSVAFIK